MTPICLPSILKGWELEAKDAAGEDPCSMLLGRLVQPYVRSIIPQWFHHFPSSFDSRSIWTLFITYDNRAGRATITTLHTP